MSELRPFCSAAPCRAPQSPIEAPNFCHGEVPEWPPARLRRANLWFCSAAPCSERQSPIEAPNFCHGEVPEWPPACLRRANFWFCSATPCRAPQSPIEAPNFCHGEVPEWPNGPVSKTGVRATVPWVRIPPSPPVFLQRLDDIPAPASRSRRNLPDLSAHFPVEFAAHRRRHFFDQARAPSVDCSLLRGARMT